MLYDDGELSYSVDEHPDTIPQGSVDMSQVLEVTSAEQLTGHPHSLALTAPDRVTFVKAASREDARWWLELLAVFPRRHKRNATFPGGRASPSLPHLGRSASPQPPRPMRHMSEVVGGGGAGGGGGSSPRTNFTTPAVKEERDPNATNASPLASLSCSLTTSGSSSSVGSTSSPRCSLVGVILKEDVVAAAAAAAAGVDMVDHRQNSSGGGRPQWVPEPSAMMSIGGGDGGASSNGSSSRDALLANPRTEYLISSGSPPTRDKLRCEDKARARRDWRHERLRDIATALTDRSPESSLALPAEGLLHLKKGWLWHREATSPSPSPTDPCDQWRRRWWVLCGPSLLGYRDQDEEAGGAPLVSIELAAVTGYSELRTDTRFGFQLQWSGGPPLTLSAVTMGIRSNWLQALRKAAPGIIESPAPSDQPSTIPATSVSQQSPSSSIPSSTSSSRHSTASSSQLTAAASAIINTNPQSASIRLRGDMMSSPSCRLSTGSSSGGGTTPTTPRSGVIMFSSDEEYRTASEGGRRDSMTDVDWMTDCGGSGGAAAGASGGSMVKTLLNRSKDQRLQQRQSRPHKPPRCQSTSSRHSTLDSNVSSPDELDNSTLLTSIQSASEADHSSRLYHHRHSVADMRTRKLHLQLQLEEEDIERRRKSAVEKELEIARGEVRALEDEARRLRELLSEATSKELKGRDAVYELEKIERDLTLKLEKLLREQKSLNRRLSESDEAIRESDERSATFNRELQAKQRIVASLQDELTCANERCAASRLENDRLYKKLQELNNNSNTPTITPPPPNPQLQSFSHLTNIDLDSPLTSLSNSDLSHHCLDLRIRFERAVAEIRELQQRLREAHAQVDVLQLERVRFSQRVEAARSEYDGRVEMLKERVDDLTGKLLQAERARLRVSAASAAVSGGRGQREGGSSGSGGSKMGRRSLSLKGRESFSVNKEVEDKVTLLEAKLLSLSSHATTPTPGDAQRGRTTRRSKYQQQSISSGRRSTDNGSPIDDRSLRKLRRKSLDGATASEPMKLLMRLNALEERMGSGGGVEGGGSGRASSESLNGVGGEGSGGGTAVGELVEESETETLSLARAAYLQCITPPSPTPQQSPLFDVQHMRELGKILRVPDIDNILHNISSNSDTAQTVVAQLEGVLRRQYTELHERRVRLRERGELDGRAQMELLAEKIAFEDVIIGRILSTLNPKSTFISRETLETKHLLNHVQSKLNLTSQTPSCASTYLHTSVSYLTQLFTRHLLANTALSSTSTSTVEGSNMLLIDQASLKDLLFEQRKVHGMLEEYQRVKLTQLVKRLSADTMALVKDDSCSLVGEVTGKVWDAARRRVSEELIHSEVRHVLMKTAQHYEHLNSSDHTAGFTFTLTAIQRCQLEQWTDCVEEHLLTRMEHFITHLNNTYQHQTNIITSDTTTTSSTDLLLHEYADVIAHVALIDARIATLQMKCSAVPMLEDDHEEAGLNVLLEASNDVSVVEFKAALKVARLCAGQMVKGEGDVRVVGSSSSCAKCAERQDLAAGFSWMGASYNSYDSLPDLTPPPLPPSPTDPITVRSPSPTSSPPTPTTYHHQIALLRHAFQQTLTDQQSTTVEQQRHLHLVESSVERLRVVCEQVLVAMERMHRGALQRMRVNHKEEMEMVRREKEQALAEETQATLAALDAMRKAHEAEVVKEVARFKHELSRQQASELLELRERLSVKCLEAAALQEQLGSATRQLAHAHQHILHLEQQRAPSAS